MRSYSQWLDLLERQCAVIDGLDKYLAACDRRGLTDDLALSTHAQAIRVYRKTLASAPVEALFLYGSRAAASRQA